MLNISYTSGTISIMDGSSQREPQLYGQPNEAAPYQSTSQTPNEVQQSTEEISWTAVEFVEHNKSSLWFLVLAAIGVGMAVGIYFLTDGDWIAAVIVLALAVIFGVGATRKPRTLDYKLDDSGITVDKKLFNYEYFSHFTVVQEGSVESILLTPVRRWSVPLSLYFSPEAADKIIDTLSAYVPFERHDPSYVDKFLHRIRF